MSTQEETQAFLEKWISKIDIEGKLLDVMVMTGVPLKHPRTGKWHDRSGLGCDTHDDLVKYGDAFIFTDERPFELR